MSPINLVPKFIPLKYLDDVLVLAYVIKKIKEELEVYKKWRSENGISDIDDKEEETVYIDLN